MLNGGAFYVSAGDYFCYTRHEPVGVCGQIIPVSSLLTILCLNNVKRQCVCVCRNGVTAPHM